MIYEEMRSATERNLTLTEWFELDREERAHIVAYDRIVAKVEAAQVEEAKRD